jgi:SAM-dependent methyltransferase
VRDAVRTRSFRDPSGFVALTAGRVLRFVTDETAAETLREALALKATERAILDDRLIPTRILGAEETRNLDGLDELGTPALVAEHEPIWFPSYAYEWPPEMLHAAAELTLDLSEQLLQESWGLKDATPYNVLFRGPNPVFVDLGSLERRDNRDPLWMPHAQFSRTFLIPLLLHRQFGAPLSDVFLSRRDGNEPEDAYRHIGPLRRFLPPYLGLVSLPTWLKAAATKRQGRIYQRRLLSNPEQARFILGRTFRKLRRTLGRLAPRASRRSTWSSYMDENVTYDTEGLEQKEAFVRDAVESIGAGTVLDIGCNTGHFSAIAARGGAKVVAVDLDPVAAGKTWIRARQESLDILPLVVDLARPSPAIGWRNRECPSFLDRAQGRFDLVMMLALVHHLLVSERIPLDELVEIAAGLTRRYLIVEYVDPQDLRFREIARGRDDLHRSLSPEIFKRAFTRRFHFLRKCSLEQTDRCLYLYARSDESIACVHYST